MRKINLARIQDVEFATSIRRVTPEDGTSFDEILQPAYWAHVAERLRLKYGDRFEVLPADRSYFAELMVMDAGPGWAKVELLRRKDFGRREALAVPVPETDEFEVRHRGGAGWSVIRKADKQPLYERGATKDDAARWLTDHLRKLAA